MRLLILLITCAFAWCAAAATNPAAAPQHLELQIPLTAGASREIAKTGQRASTLKAVVDIPAGFDAKRKWPILFVFAPSGASAINAQRAYTNAGLSHGWIVAAVDGPKVAVTQDTSTYAWELVSALLYYLRTGWPQSKSWPVACAGFSGGAKRAAMIAAEMARRGDQVTGIFMGGCNEDRATLGYQLAQPGRSYLEVPMFLSNGTRDQIAPMDKAAMVKASMETSGFRNVRLEQYDGDHRLSTNQLHMALHWFLPQPLSR